MDALSAPLLFFWMNLLQPNKPKEDHARNAMFTMLKAFSSQDENSVIEMTEGYTMRELAKATMLVLPNGFIIVPGKYGFLRQYFLSHGWERLPFTFREKYIFRKPVRMSA